MYYDELTNQIFNPFTKFINGYWKERDSRMTINPKTGEFMPWVIGHCSLITDIKNAMIHPFRAKKKMIKDYFNGYTDQDELKSFYDTLKHFRTHLNDINNDQADIVIQNYDAGYISWEQRSYSPVLSIIDSLSMFLDKLEQTMSSKWIGLFNKLVDNKYISGSPDTFTHIMEYKQLSPETEKIKWLTYKSDAIFFGDSFGHTIKQLNDCFASKDGKPFDSQNRPNSPPKHPLPDIIKQFSDPTEA